MPHLVDLKNSLVGAGLVAFGCVQTAGESNSNQIPSQVRFLSLTVHMVFIFVQMGSGVIDDVIAPSDRLQ